MNIDGVELKNSAQWICDCVDPRAGRKDQKSDDNMHDEAYPCGEILPIIDECHHCKEADRKEESAILERKFRSRHHKNNDECENRCEPSWIGERLPLQSVFCGAIEEIERGEEFPREEVEEKGEAEGEEGEEEGHWLHYIRHAERRCALLERVPSAMRSIASRDESRDGAP